MRKYFKDTWTNYVIALAFSFMLFIIEPINLYSSNLNDFWFDLNILLKPIILMFVGVFLIIVIISNIIYFINKKVFKYVNIVLFIVFLCTYIQGNFLAGNLPLLDGEVIDWSKYLVDNIISIVLWLFVIIGTILLCKKIKIDNYLKYSGYITLAIFAMLSVSLISVFLTTDVLKYKEKGFISTTTFKNLDKYSSNSNFIVLLLDAVDSRHFAKSIKDNSEFKDTLKDFTYYPDTMSMHPFTKESIPLILTNEIYKNQEDEIQFITNAMKKSPLFNNLYEKNYEVNVYENELLFYDNDASKIANVVNEKKYGTQLDKKKFITYELQYISFRYLPYFLKQYSNVEKVDFNNTKTEKQEVDRYSDDDHVFLDYINNHEIKTDSNNNFKFIHLIGAHVPFKFKKDLKIVDSATYADEVDGCLHITDIYLNKLKQYGVYDNSVIMIMADHGYNYNKDNVALLEGRQNPILYIKGINEKHDEMLTSDKSISFTDLNDAYNDLLNQKNSSELFSNITNDRKRNYIMYEYEDPNHMYEYENDGKAWETDKMHKTGREYNLN